MTWKQIATIALIFACCTPLITEPVLGQEYVIQSGDKINVTFWQQPDLNTLARVSHNGTIDLPVIGRIKAAGLTPSQLSENIVEQMSHYRINITQASVVLTEYQRNKVYVTGQVASPGPYSFEVIPHLWKILQEAGGPLETADLKRVTIIRPGQKENIIVTDLTQFFERGDFSQLPRIYGGDTIHVPSIPVTGGTGGESPPGQSPFLSKNDIYLVGEVASPGRYNFEKDLSLLDALIMAGGPTPDAKLSDVRILKRLKFGNSSVMKINLDKYLSTSEPVPLRLHPGDTVYVPRRASALSFIVNNLLLPIATSTIIFLIIGTARR